MPPPEFRVLVQSGLRATAGPRDKTAELHRIGWDADADAADDDDDSGATGPGLAIDRQQRSADTTGEHGRAGSLGRAGQDECHYWSRLELCECDAETETSSPR